MDNLNDVGKSVVSTLESRAQYAGFWRRFFAFMIDFIICMIITTVIYMISFIGITLYNVFIIHRQLEPSNSINATYVIGLLFLVQCLYDAFYLSYINMATPGKRLLGIKVVDLNGNRISFTMAFSRGVIKYVLMEGLGMLTPICGLIALVGLVNPSLIVLTKKKQALHDYKARTVVVRTKSSQHEQNNKAT